MSKSSVFLDTSGWISQINEQEKNHQEAVRLFRELGRRRRSIVITDWVIAEAGNGLAKAPFRSAFLSSLGDLLKSSQVQVIFIDENLLNLSVTLYANRPDKAWGLVDCSSFVIMSQLGIREAMTADHHFEQAGFRCLLGRSGEIKDR